MQTQVSTSGKLEPPVQRVSATFFYPNCQCCVRATNFLTSSPHVKTIPLGLSYLSALVPIAHISAFKLMSIHPTPRVARYLMHIRSSALSSTAFNVTGAVCFCPFEPSRLLSHSVVCQNKSTEPLWASRDKTALSLQRRLEATLVRSNETEEIRMLSSVYV